MEQSLKLSILKGRDLYGAKVELTYLREARPNVALFSR